MSTERPMLVLNRNFVLRSTLGHTVGFQKGVPVRVPPALYREAIAIGAVAEDGSEPDMAPVETNRAKAPLDPNERAEAIQSAVEMLAEANERDDFTAAGLPSVDAVSKITGWKVSAREIANEWTDRSIRNSDKDV